MKTVKPFRLSIVTRPYRWQRRDHLGVAVFALADLSGATPLLLAEQALWQLAADEIGGVLDLAVPKLHPEFLATGYAYSGHQADPAACAVRIRVGPVEKSLLVFGDRYWLDGRMTAPTPFESMRLDWTRAYGGPDVAENPLGMGARDEVINGAVTRRVPNIEAPLQRIGAPGQRLEPAGFGGLAPEWPQRFAYMGRQYGERWLEQDYPGFAADMDWRYFNAAAPDQWFTSAQALTPAADYEIWHMHPDKAVLRGQLPDWRARCFASRRADGGELEEIDLRLTTAWFFPHREQAILIWHGHLPIAEDDAADIKHIMPALETPDTRRDVEHYREVLRKRLDPERGAVHALRDSDLAPRAVHGPGPESGLPDVAARPSLRRLRQGLARRRDEARAELVAQGFDAGMVPATEDAAPSLDMDDLPALLERMDREREQARAELTTRREEALADPDLRAVVSAEELDALGRPGASGRPDLDEALSQVAELGKATQAVAPESPLAPDAVPLADRLATQMRQSHRLSAHAFERPAAQPPHRARRTRERLEQAMRQSGDLAGINLVGADLTNMDLRGARLCGMHLDGADLTGARLDGCDLSEAVLAHAILSRVSLRGALLRGANLGKARAGDGDFSGADFTDSTLHEMVFERCNLAEGVLMRTRMQGTVLSGCDLSRARVGESSAVQVRLDGVRFDAATIERSVFLDSTFRAVSFAGARLVRAAFVKVACEDGLDLNGANLETCSFSGGTGLAGTRAARSVFKACGLRGTTLRGADLAGAMLTNCDFSECDLRDAVLDRAVTAESLFVRADFTGASLRDADLRHTVLSKAVLLQADLSGANLFRADVSQAHIDGSTRLDGAYTRNAKLWPRRAEVSA